LSVRYLSGVALPSVTKHNQLASVARSFPISFLPAYTANFLCHRQ